MNRKYRVYDKQEKRYVTDEWMWVIRPDGTLAYVDYDDVIGYLDAVAEYSTGLTDKNGKDVFEGDIVTARFVSNRSKQRFTVVFEQGIFLFDNNYVKVPSFDIYSISVIGSIHDTPVDKEGSD